MEGEKWNDSWVAMSGFKIKCLECDSKQTIDNGEGLISVDLKEIKVYPAKTRAIIECECGNCSDFDY